MRTRLKPDTFPLKYDHPRLVIPFYDVSGNLFAFQGRGILERKQTEVYNN